MLALRESNAPFNTFSRVATPGYNYNVHPMVRLTWGIPVPFASGLSFEGFANLTASMGKDFVSIAVSWIWGGREGKFTLELTKSHYF